MVTIDLQEKINMLFEDDEDMKNRLLNGDEDAIQNLVIMTRTNIDPLDIISAYESKEFKPLYEKAKKIVQIKQLYIEMCNWHARNSMKSHNKK